MSLLLSPLQLSDDDEINSFDLTVNSPLSFRSASASRRRISAGRSPVASGKKRLVFQEAPTPATPEATPEFMPQHLQHILCESYHSTLMSSSDDGVALRVEPLTEQQVLHDLLYVLCLVKGQYILDVHADADPDVLGPSLASLVDRVLPLARARASIRSFCNCASPKGVVLQGMKRGLSVVLSEFHSSVLQMESELLAGHLTGARLLYVTQPLHPIMQMVSHVVQRVIDEQLTGALLLNMLHEMSARAELAGGELQRFVDLLLQSASQPYFELMSRWICFGVLIDPHHEFLVQEEPSADDNKGMDYWSRFYLNQHVPSFLDGEKVLLTGKYVSLLRHFNIVLDDSPRIEYESGDSPLWKQLLELAYERANSLLLSTLREKLVSLLQALQLYFLVGAEMGISHFLDSMEDDMEQSVLDVDKTRAQSLLELALATSCSKNNIHRDQLRVVLTSCTLAEQLSKQVSKDGVWNPAASLDDTVINPSLLLRESIALDFQVLWPLSLLICPAHIQGYSLISRRCLQLSLINDRISTAWKILRLWGSRLQINVTASYALLSFMRSVLNSVQFHVLTVSKSSFQKLENIVVNGSTVEEILLGHDQYLSFVLKVLVLLQPKQSIKCLHDVFDLIEGYCAFVMQLDGSAISRDTVKQLVTRKQFQKKSVEMMKLFKRAVVLLSDQLETMALTEPSFASLADMLRF